MPIRNEHELDDLLSTPSPADIDAMARLDGNLMILGAGGKMGPSLAARARRAAPSKRVIAVARFSNAELPKRCADQGIETIACDLLETGALATLPDAPNVIFMAARKFGTTGAAHLTWAMNTFLPASGGRSVTAIRGSSHSRRGNVYPLLPDRARRRGGVDARCARRRVRAIGSGPRTHVRIRLARVGNAGLPPAPELRHRFALRRPRRHRDAPCSNAVRWTCAWVSCNVIWQGDANSYCLRAVRALPVAAAAF